MGKSTVITTDITTNDTSQTQGLTASRVQLSGNNNTTNYSLTDAGAIKEAITLANTNTEGMFAWAHDLLGMTSTLASQTLQQGKDNAQAYLQNLTDSSKATAGTLKDAYEGAAQGGLKLQSVVLGLGLLVAVVVVMKGMK